MADGRRRLGSLLIVVVLLVAGCSSAGSPAAALTSTPTLTPSLAATAPPPTPTPSPSPSPSLAPTPSPSPSPVDVAQLIADFKSGAVKQVYPAVSAAQLWSQYQAIIKTDAALVSGLGVSPWVNHDGKRGDADTLALCLQKSLAQELSDEMAGCAQLVPRAVRYVNRTGRDIDFLKTLLGYIVHDCYACEYAAQSLGDQWFVGVIVTGLQGLNP